MSQSPVQQEDHLLKQCLLVDGMRWKHRNHILRSDRSDRRVMLALRNGGVRLQPHDIQREFCSLMQTAFDLAQRGGARNADTTYDFVLAVRRRHRLGRCMSHRLFVELFRALINGRRRYIRRTAASEDASEPTSQLAGGVDRFLRAAAPYYSDAEIFLQLNEEPVEHA